MSFLTVFRGVGQPGSLRLRRESLQDKVPKIAEYKPDFDTFAKWEQHHRHHQVEALASMQGKNIGQISMPTGTGKTRVQVALHIKDMIQSLINKDFGVYVTAAHRLALCTQLLEELVAVAVNAGIPFDMLFIGSSRFPEDKIHAKFKDQGFNRYVNEATSTTSGSEVAHAVARAQARERHTIAVSTYHSFHRMHQLDQVSLVTYDEAHVTVADGFLDNIKIVKPKIKRNFFFTATRRVQGDSEGMNNVEMFGPVLYEVSPRAMIEAAEIVPPRIHVIRTEDQDDDYNNHSMLIRTVVTGFKQHKALVKELSANPDLIGAKLLITTTGNLELSELHDDEVFQNYCRSRNIEVFSYSSERGSYYNFHPVSRNEAMSKMRDLRDDQDAILLHIDILTEGIDLPSITGVMPFRELNTIKLLQTLGRAARLLSADRKRLYTGELAPQNRASYIKPYCWLILPEFFESLGNANAMKNAIRTIINAYEVPVEEYSTVDHYRGELINDNDRITARDEVLRRDRETNLIHTIEEVMLERMFINSDTPRIDMINQFFGVEEDD